jgi:hypothetical protein
VDWAKTCISSRASPRSGPLVVGAWPEKLQVTASFGCVVGLRRFARGFGNSEHQIMSKSRRISFPCGIGRAEDRTHLNRSCSATATSEMELESKQPGGPLVRNLGKMERIGRGLNRRSHGRLLWPKLSEFKPGRRSRSDTFST